MSESPINGRDNQGYRCSFNDNFTIAKQNGVITGGVTISNGQATFDGTSGKIVMQSKGGRYFGKTVRIKFTFNAFTAGQTRTIAVINNSSASFPRIRYEITNNAGTYELKSADGVFGTRIVANIVPGNRYDVLFVAGGCYINGQNGLLVPGNLTTTSIGIDKTIEFGYYTGYFPGTIDLYEEYNRKLSLAEANLLYNNSLYINPKLPLEISLNGLKGIIEDKIGKYPMTVGGNITKVFEGGKGILKFGGGLSSGVIKFTGQVLKDEPWGISLWLKHTGTNGSGRVLSMNRTLSRGGGTPPNGNFFDFVWSNGNQWKIFNTNLDIKKNLIYNNFVILRNGTRFTLYQNGVSIYTTNTFSYSGYVNGDFYLMGIGTTSLSEILGFIPLCDVFTGVPSSTTEQDKIASQLYYSQKHLFGL